MGDFATKQVEFPPAVEIALAVLGFVGFILTAAALYVTVRWTPRPQNEEPRRGRPLHPIRFWRPSQYSLALGNLEEFRNQLREGAYHKGFERGRVTESDLVRWITQLALTCAAQMVPQSLGKANLFRVSKIVEEEGRPTEVRVYSSDFVGVFSPGQMVSTLDPTHLRNLRLAEHRQREDETPAALQCVVDRIPLVQSLRKRAGAFDKPERQLGATHILAIPLVKGFHAISHMDQIVSMTVDLRFGRFMGWVLDRRDYQKRSFYRRACKLHRLLSEIEQISDPRFRPIGDYTKLQSLTGQSQPAAPAENPAPSPRLGDTV